MILKEWFFGVTEGMDEIWRFPKSWGVALVFMKSTLDIGIFPDIYKLDINHPANLGFSYGFPMVWGTPFKRLKGTSPPVLEYPHDIWEISEYGSLKPLQSQQ